MTDSKITDQSMDGALPPELAADGASGSVRVVRHSFGAKSAAAVLVVMLAIAGALGNYLMNANDPAVALPDPPTFAPRHVPVAAAAPEEADAAPATKPAPVDPEAEQNRMMDVAFERLNNSDISSVNEFLASYGKNERAIKLGYVSKAESWRDTLIKLDAEAEAETLRKQKSVPWDME